MTDSPYADVLIIVDVQRGFVEGPHALPAASRLLSAIGTLLTSARAAGVLIVHLQNQGSEGSLDEAGTAGWELILQPLDEEPIIQKTTDDPFLATNLEDIIHEHEASSLVLCGLQSEMCIAATARGALSRGLSVILPHDAHATYPIPHQGPHAPAIPAHHVARVAEWSLGDEVILVEAASSVQFT